MAGRVACPSCSKGYSWKAELAGRKVKCTCGTVFRMPEDDPAEAKAPPEHDIFELDDADAPMPSAAPAVEVPPEPKMHRTCPSCNTRLVAEAVLCTACGLDLTTGRKLRSDGISKEEKTEADARAYARSQYHLPGGLLVGGMLFQAIVVAMFGDAGSVIGAVIAAGFETLIVVTFMLIGCVVAAKLIGVGFGPIQVAALKLGAVFVIATDASVVVQLLPITIPLLAFAVFIIAMAGMMMWMFDMDPDEAIVTLGILAVVYLGLQMFVLSMLIALMPW